MAAAAVGVVNIVLLYRRITSIGTITVSLWIGTLLTTLAVVITGAMHFNAARALISTGCVYVFVGFRLWPRRRFARRCLRLPGLLRHLLHRRRSEGSGPDHSALDHHQRHRGWPLFTWRLIFR